MRTADLLALIADAPHTGIIITAPDLVRPGPAIVEVNDALLDLTGYTRDRLLAAIPRILQGPETSRLSTMNIARAMRRREPVAECLVNYRADGTPYICSLEIHPLFSASGALEHFVAFEREVVRRRGRPRAGFAGRFVAVEAEALLPSELGWPAAA